MKETADAVGESERWWAVIGPTPRTIASTIDTTPHDKTRRLAEAFSMGDVTLRPAGKLLVEYQRDEPLNLAGYIEHESWPIFVEGTTPADIDLQHDRATAARAVRAAVLLSLEWDEPWIVRDSPFRHSVTPPQLPDSWPSPKDEDEDEPMAIMGIEAYPETFPPVQLPESLDRAWGLLDEHEVRWSSLAWHEGLVMQYRHPSFAAVAYVSSIEALSYSQWAARDPRFDTSGSGMRVKSMLQTVITGPGASRAIRNIQKIRNKTAHAGRLFAFESSYGATSVLRLDLLDADGAIKPSISPNPDDDVQEFLWTLRRLRSASHALLRQALQLE